MQQVEWASLLPHRAQQQGWNINQDLKQAVEFEMQTEAEEIDKQRDEVAKQWIWQAAQLESERSKLLDKVGLSHCRLRQRIHYPFINSLIVQLDHPDKSLFADLLQGFPVVGKLPPCLLEADVEPKPKTVKPLAELLQERQECNRAILATVTESEYSGDLETIFDKDFDLGALGAKQVVSDELVAKVHLARRIAVRELRPKGWRTRAVDDMTEMQLNPSTEQSDKQVNSSVLALVWVMLMFLQSGIECRLWKRDIQNAFRRLPVRTEHLFLVWVVWMSSGEKVAAPHLGMPFGAVASVVAWHRVGSWLAKVIMTVARAPMARYVDDYFGASKRGVKWSGGRLLSLLCSLTGLLCDSEKDVDDDTSMIVLGLSVDLSMEQARVLVRLEQSKATMWKGELEDAVKEDRLHSWQAAKFAGRIQWTLTAGKSRAGRSYLKAFFAQAVRPLPEGRISRRLQQACSWVGNYLEERPASCWTSVDEKRPHIRSWSDASGVDRMVAVLVLLDDEWHYTVAEVPMSSLGDFLQRNDNFIGVLELLAPVLALGTWGDKMADTLWTAWIDNQGVLHSLLRGSSVADDLNTLIGRMWMVLAKIQCDLSVMRVESKANIADGPTRKDFSEIAALGAKFHPPCWPTWASSVWN